MFAFTDDQRMALVFDFTPAASVTVVDLVKRQPLGRDRYSGLLAGVSIRRARHSPRCARAAPAQHPAGCQRPGRRPQRIQAIQSARHRPVVHGERDAERHSLFPELAWTHPADRHEDRGREGAARLVAGVARGEGGELAAERLADPRERREVASVCADAAQRRGGDAQESGHRGVGVQSRHQDAREADAAGAARAPRSP